MKSPVSRRSLLVNGGLGVLLTGGAGLAYLSLGDDGAQGTTGSSTRTVTVSRGDLTATVSASGSIASARTRPVSFATSGTVSKIYVKVGDKVAKGAKLATLDQTEALENLNAAKANLAALGDVDTSKAQDYARYVQTRNAYNDAVRALDATVLYAPIAATVTAVNGTAGTSTGSSSSGGGAQGGTSTTSTSGLVELQDTAKLKVEGSFTEADTTKLKVGQSATISFAALSGVTATGKVTAIGAAPTTTNNVVSYTVTISLAKKPAKVRIGQTSTVTVTTAKKSGVLYVPTAAVRTAGGQSTVTVLRDGVATPQTVTVGISGDSGTEIVSGLEEGDQVQIVTTTTNSTNTGRFPGGGQGGFPGGGGGNFGGGGQGARPGGGR